MSPQKTETEVKEKPGVKTTEFWILLVVLLIGVLVKSDAFGEGHWAMKAASLVTDGLAFFGYTASRAKIKFGGSMERASLGKPQPPAE